MGSCFSKKKTSPHSLPPPAAAAATATSYGYTVADNGKPKSELELEAAEPGELKMKVKKPRGKQEEIEEEDEGEDAETQVQVKKEILIIKHRKSHDGRGGDRDSKTNPLLQNQIQQASLSDGVVVVVSPFTSPPVETATAAKPDEIVEELDKVVKRVKTQSSNKEELDAILIQCGRLSRSNSSGNNRKYSGSKRSYDFDANCSRDDDDVAVNVNDVCNDAGADQEKSHGHRQSLQSRSSSPSSQGRRRRRTPSRERNQHQQQQRSNSRERPTSRSPGKRSSSQQDATSSSSNANGNANHRPGPGKMVSVPAAAISSLATADKANNNISSNGEGAASIKRISVKRNVGSPRAQSPARANAREQQPSFSRSSSRKAEHSPYRRNPLAEIDPNSLAHPQPHNSSRTKREIQAQEDIALKLPTPGPNFEMNNKRIVPQGVNYIASSTTAMDNKATSANCSAKDIVAEQAKGQALGKPQTLTRSRSSRRSRDIDIDLETTTLSEPAPSLYTTLLLQDIQNFHQQNIPNVVSLPPCVTKACSILEAVADLNSATKNQPKDPFVESEVVVNDDLMEPSFHKYVTVRRGTGALERELLDMEDQESSGSNSFVSGHSHSQQIRWGLSSSSWEPNSADSTDCWTSRSNTKDEDHKSLMSLDMDEADKKRFNERSGGIGRGRLPATNGTKGLHV